MKKTTLLLFIFTVFITSANAQLKIKSMGKVIIGAGTVENDDMLTIDAGTSNIRALTLRVNHSVPWWQSSVAKVKNDKTVSWVVNYNWDRFFVHGDGSVWAKSSWYGSDESIKQNISTITGALDMVLALRGVYFQYKPEVTCNECGGDTVTIVDSAQYIGLIAQELQGILPEAVRLIPGVGPDSTGLLAVNYPNLVAVLIEAIKEQQTQISEINGQLAICCGSMLMNNEDSNEMEESFISPSPNQKNTKKQVINKGKYSSALEECKLYQNTPNPFSELTTISYNLNREYKSAVIYIYNLQGEQIKSIPITQRGKGKIEIQGSELKAGMYLYSLIVDNREVNTLRMILTK